MLLPRSGAMALRPGRCRRAQSRAAISSAITRGSDPPPATPSLLARGQERYQIFCTPCHGPTGDGDGVVVERGFPRPPPFGLARLRQAPAQHFFDVISNGYGVMYRYRPARAARRSLGDRRLHTRLAARGGRVAQRRRNSHERGRDPTTACPGRRPSLSALSVARADCLDDLHASRRPARLADRPGDFGGSAARRARAALRGAIDGRSMGGRRFAGSAARGRRNSAALPGFPASSVGRALHLSLGGGPGRCGKGCRSILSQRRLPRPARRRCVDWALDRRPSPVAWARRTAHRRRRTHSLSPSPSISRRSIGCFRWRRAFPRRPSERKSRSRTSSPRSR